MNFENWKNKGSKLNPQDIALIESKLGRSLPEDYKKMLLEVNGGRPPYYIMPLPGKGDTIIGEFYGLGGHSSLDLTNLPMIKYDELPEGFIPIGTDMGGNHIALGIDGSVYWKDHERLSPRSGLIKVSNSFTDFLDVLKEDVQETNEEIERLAEKGTPVDLEIYLGNGHKLDSKSLAGRTLSQELARFGNLSLLKMCVEKGASMDGAIHLAAMNGHLGVVQYLVEVVGVDVIAKDSKNRSPKMCAFLNPEIQVYLEQKGG